MVKGRDLSLENKIMNGDIQITNQIADKFKLGKKWFWVGIAVAFVHAFAGLIYGIVLLFEKDHRKEGIIIIAFAIAWALFSYFVVGPWLLNWMAAKGLIIPKLNIQQVQLPQQLQ